MCFEKLNILANEIEIVRKKMIELSEETTFTDPKLVEVSQMLDELLNQFSQLKRQRNKIG